MIDDTALSCGAGNWDGGVASSCGAGDWEDPPAAGASPRSISLTPDSSLIVPAIDVCVSVTWPNITFLNNN